MVLDLVIHESILKHLRLWLVKRKPQTRAERPSQKKACVRRGAMLPFRHIADKESTQGGVQLRPVELGSHPRGFGDPGVEG